MRISPGRRISAAPASAAPGAAGPPSARSGPTAGPLRARPNLT